MSLLDHGPNTVELWPAVDAVDGRGNRTRLPALGPPQLLEDVWVRPGNGEGYVLISRTFPAGRFSRVSHAGRDFDVEADPIRPSGGPTSLGHVRVALKPRAPEEPPSG